MSEKKVELCEVCEQAPVFKWINQVGHCRECALEIIGREILDRMPPDQDRGATLTASHGFKDVMAVGDRLSDSPGEPPASGAQNNFFFPERDQDQTTQENEDE